MQDVAQQANAARQAHKAHPTQTVQRPDSESHAVHEASSDIHHPKTHEHLGQQVQPNVNAHVHINEEHREKVEAPKLDIQDNDQLPKASDTHAPDAHAPVIVNSHAGGKAHAISTESPASTPSRGHGEPARRKDQEEVHAPVIAPSILHSVSHNASHIHPSPHEAQSSPDVQPPGAPAAGMYLLVSLPYVTHGLCDMAPSY